MEGAVAHALVVVERPGACGGGGGVAHGVANASRTRHYVQSHVMERHGVSMSRPENGKTKERSEGKKVSDVKPLYMRKLDLF